MTDYPKVSVVTITYGHEHYITQTIDGVLMQNYPGEIEFIIANDNSPDHTDEVVKDYFSINNLPVHFSIKYTKHEVNKGMMPNFFWALNQASGKYIALCEGDDYWTDPLKLQKQVDYLENNEEYGMVFSNANVLLENEEANTNATRGLAEVKESRDFSPKEIFDHWTVATASVLFRSSSLEADFKKISSNENFMFGDIVLFLYLANKGKLFGMTDYLVAYRRHGGGATNFNLNILFYEKHFNHLRQIERTFENQVNLKAHTNTLADYGLSLALHNFSKGKVILGCQYIISSYKFNPKYIFSYFKNKFKI